MTTSELQELEESYQNHRKIDTNDEIPAHISDVGFKQTLNPTPEGL